MSLHTWLYTCRRAKWYKSLTGTYLVRYLSQGSSSGFRFVSLMWDRSAEPVHADVRTAHRAPPRAAARSDHCRRRGRHARPSPAPGPAMIGSLPHANSYTIMVNRDGA